MGHSHNTLLALLATLFLVLVRSGVQYRQNNLTVLNHTILMTVRKYGYQKSYMHKSIKLWVAISVGGGGELKVKGMCDVGTCM